MGLPCRLVVEVEVAGHPCQVEEEEVVGHRPWVGQVLEVALA